MSRSQREEKGGKRVKKEQRPSRRGVRRMFLTCCILAIILLALWQTGMLPFPGQTSDPTPPSGITSAEPDTSAPDNTQTDNSQPGQVGRDRPTSPPRSRTPPGTSSWSTAGTPCPRATSPS